jgi:hypothetical protein
MCIGNDPGAGLSQPAGRADARQAKSAGQRLPSRGGGAIPAATWAPAGASSGLACARACGCFGYAVGARRPHGCVPRLRRLPPRGSGWLRLCRDRRADLPKQPTSGRRSARVVPLAGGSVPGRTRSTYQVRACSGRPYVQGAAPTGLSGAWCVAVCQVCGHPAGRPGRWRAPGAGRRPGQVSREFPRRQVRPELWELTVCWSACRPTPILAVGKKGRQEGGLARTLGCLRVVW